MNNGSDPILHSEHYWSITNTRENIPQMNAGRTDDPSHTNAGRIAANEFAGIIRPYCGRRRFVHTVDGDVFLYRADDPSHTNFDAVSVVS